MIEGRLLYLLENNTALLFHRVSFYKVNLETRKKTPICRMPIGRGTTLLSKFRPFSRLIRLEPKCTGRLSETEFVVSLLGACWLIDIGNRTYKKLFENPKGFSDVINFCSTTEGIYWGDYGRNTEYRSVKVYHLSRNHQVTVVHTFAPGMVRHIHNIIEDRNGFLLFTGDNEAKAGIYKANKDWTKVNPWKIGKPRYRAVVGFSCQEGVLYATDSVESENHLRLIKPDGTELELSPINGSCIYGGEIRNHYLFSTTVEPHEGECILKIFSNKLGNGIKSRDVHILVVDKKDLNVKVVRRYKKDCWPMKLFQYGRVLFAGGQKNVSNFWCSPVACKKYDGKSIKIELNK